MFLAPVTCDVDGYILKIDQNIVEPVVYIPILVAIYLAGSRLAITISQFDQIAGLLRDNYSNLDFASYPSLNH